MFSPKLRKSRLSKYLKPLGKKKKKKRINVFNAHHFLYLTGSEEQV